MFNNIGGKLKMVAEIFTVTGIIVSIIFGILMFAENFLYGLLIMIAGSLISWLSSLVMYGFGHLIENTDKLLEQQKQDHEEQEIHEDP